MSSALTATADARILEAMEAGEFDDLPGLGKPLDLEDYFAAPSSLRMGFGMPKSAGITPPEVEAIKWVNILRQRLANASSECERRELSRELLERETELAMALERMKRSFKADSSIT